MNNELNEKIRKELFYLSDEKYRKFQGTLCPDNDNLIGVQVPKLRKIAKKIASNEDVKKYLINAYDEYYEEVMLQGLCIGYTKLNINKQIELLDIFIPKIDNWAVSDSTISGLKFTKNNLDIMWKYINKYIKNGKEFEMRFSIIMMLNYYLIDDYIDKVIENINSISNIEKRPYYVKMAIAWLLSMVYVKYPRKFMEFIKENDNLDDFTYNKSLQKIIESKRVTKEQKNIIIKLKRK